METIIGAVFTGTITVEYQQKEDEILENVEFIILDKVKIPYVNLYGQTQYKSKYLISVSKNKEGEEKDDVVKLIDVLQLVNCVLL